MRRGIPWYRSIRTRIAVLFATGALVSAALVGGVLDTGMMTSGISQLRDRAVDAVAAATATYDFTGTVPIDATVGASGAPPRVDAAIRRDTVTTWFDGRSMWASRRVASGRVLTVRIPAVGLLRQREEMLTILGLLVAGVLAAATAVGWLVAGSLTGRLRSAANTLAPAAVPARGARDEVEELIDQIEGLTDALAARLDRERAFSADVAHELRTPLTALSTAAELLPPGEEADVVVRQVTRMRRLVEDLLELARAEATFPFRAGPVDVGELVCRVVADDGDVEVVLDGPGTRVTDGAMLERVLTNLIQNARRHGAPPIRVVARDGVVDVLDSGPGFPRTVLIDGPRRFGKHGSAAGVGLGLAITTAWAHRIGAELVLDNTSTGARASVRLPDDDRIAPEGARVRAEGRPRADAI